MKKLLLINVLFVSQVQAQNFANSTPALSLATQIVNRSNATQSQISDAKSVAPYAAMSLNAYGNTQKNTTENWVPVPKSSNFQPFSTAFDYQVYEKYQNSKLVEVAIAFGGTDTLGDVVQWLGGPQYVDAVALAKDTYTKYSQFNVPITTTGHSMGGGLAQAAALFIPNANAVVFDTSPVVLNGVNNGVRTLLGQGKSAQLQNIFGGDLQINRDVTGITEVRFQPPNPLSSTKFVSETGEILTGVFGGNGTQYNFTNANPITAHKSARGFSLLVDGLSNLANPNLSPSIYVPNSNNNFNLRPSENVNSFGEPSIVSSRFNGAYSVPFGANVSVVRYDNLRFDADGTTAKFTASNALGQTSNAARNGASIVDQGRTSSNGVNFNWGRWAENQGTRFNNSAGASFIGVPVHYIYADFPTAGIAYPASGAFTFSMVGGTAPTDGAGQSGRLNNMQVRVDFGAQQFQVLNMGVSFANRNMNLTSTVLPFGQGANARETRLGLTKFIAGDLTGTCTGAACGTSTIGFINGRFAGPTANGIVAGYGVRNSGGAATTINIGGVVGLTR